MKKLAWCVSCDKNIKAKLKREICKFVTRPARAHGLKTLPIKSTCQKGLDVDGIMNQKWQTIEIDKYNEE